MSLVQIVDSPQLLLLTVKAPPGGGSLPAATPLVFPFRVPTPDSRVTASLALLITSILPAATFPFDVTFANNVQYSLWLAAREQDFGGSGLMVPTVNLVGTKAAPLAIPSDVNVMGYSDDFAGGQDELYGELTVLAPAGFAPPGGLRVALYTRYQPSACEICDEEWSEIIEQCNPSVQGAVQL